MEIMTNNQDSTNPILPEDKQSTKTISYLAGIAERRRKGRPQQGGAGCQQREWGKQATQLMKPDVKFLGSLGKRTFYMRTDKVQGMSLMNNS